MIFWSIFIGLYALSGLWAAVACLFLGKLLLFIYQEVSVAHMFSFTHIASIRSSSSSFRHLTRTLKSKGVRAFCYRFSGDITTILILLLFPLLVGCAAIIYPGVLDVLLRKQIYRATLQSGVSKAILDYFVLGIIIGVLVLGRGLFYIARPRIQRRSVLPQLLIPKSFSRVCRDQFAAYTFLYYYIDFANKCACFYPPLFALVVLVNIPSGSNNSSPPTAIQNLLNFGIVAGLAALAFIPPSLFFKKVRGAVIAVRASMALCIILWPPVNRNAKTRAKSMTIKEDLPGMATDSLGVRRERLAEIAIFLNDSAARLDKKKAKSFAPHPTSTVLRAVARSIHHFLKSDESITNSLSSGLSNSLTQTFALLVAPHNPADVQDLAKRVCAFDYQGNPAVESTEKPPGHLARIVKGTMEQTQTTSSFLKNVASIVAFIVLILLLTRSHANVNSFLTLFK